VSRTNLARFDEAMAFVRSIPDPVTQRLLNRAMFFVVRRTGTEGKLPEGDFDLLFFLETLAGLLGKREQPFIRRILDGEDLSVDDPSSAL
jgi:hypothetical protein